MSDGNNSDTLQRTEKVPKCPRRSIRGTLPPTMPRALCPRHFQLGDRQRAWQQLDLLDRLDLAAVRHGLQVLREPAAGDGLDISYGVRPEHLAVVECGSAGSVPGEVVVVEPTGAETELLVRIGTSDISVISHGRANIGPGDQIALRVTPGSVHLFDQKSGSRIAEVQ